MKTTVIITAALLVGPVVTACGGDNHKLTEEPAVVGDGDDSDANGSDDKATDDDDSADDAELEAVLEVKDYVAEELFVLHAAAVAIRKAAPAADADGWNAQDDPAAVAEMRAAWKDARAAYERVEGAIAVLFPNYDASTDERYDGFIEQAPDDNLFDGTGVTGVHAIERILWADSQPRQVVEFESALPNYVAAAFPSNQDEARDFKGGLSKRLVEDTAAMAEQFEPLALDAPSAFRGVIGSMEEQVEKVALAATGEDESRYAQYTLSDMRANLGGGRAIFEAFVPWLEAEGAEDLATEIVSAFDEVERYYDDLDGDAVPEVPSGWNPDDPSDDDLETDYGQLFSRLTEQADPDRDGSLVALMLQAAARLGIAELPDE
jgi:iron uptake system component EfeO